MKIKPEGMTAIDARMVDALKLRYPDKSEARILRAVDTWSPAERRAVRKHLKIK
jgi:hypothetical protein